MTTTAWIVSFTLNTLFWLWIARWGGAERLEGTFSSGCLVSIFAPGWSADGLRLFAYVMLAASAVLFITGLFQPEMRRLWF
jgi:hypothetical protein